MDFLTAYSTLASGNEAPEVFHRWCAISALSSLVSRRVWIDQGVFIVHPNLYIILVGDPACGKSTAMSIARKVVRQIPDVAIAPSAITLQALTEMMGDDNGPCKRVFKYNEHGQDMVVGYSHITIFANELVTLLGVEPMQMINFFTDIWDNPAYENKTKNKGHDIIDGPFVTLLACMTPEVTGQLLKQSIISGGFSRRCLFVFSAERNKPVPRPQMTLEQHEALDFCKRWGNVLQKVQGPFKWTREAEAFFDSWYVKNYDRMNSVTDIITAGYLRTKDSLLIKISMLISLAKSTDLILNVEDMREALQMLDRTEGNISKVFVGAGQNKQADIAGKIVSLLQSRKTAMPEKMIIASMFQHGNQLDIKQCLEYLITVGEIERTYIDKNGVKIPTVRALGVDLT
jgi:hypothetical protein